MILRIMKSYFLAMIYNTVYFGVSSESTAWWHTVLKVFTYVLYGKSQYGLLSDFSGVWWFMIQRTMEINVFTMLRNTAYYEVTFDSSDSHYSLSNEFLWDNGS